MFVQCLVKPICLVCNESIAVNKECNLKHHYQSKHTAKYHAYTGQFKNNKIVFLKRFVCTFILYLYILCSFLHLKIYVAHWLIPKCTLLPIQFETRTYWRHLVSDALKPLHFEKLFLIRPTPLCTSCLPSPILRFGPWLKKLADPWSIA